MDVVLGTFLLLFSLDGFCTFTCEALQFSTSQFYFLSGYESSTRSTQLIRRWGLPRKCAPGQWVGRGGEEKESGHVQEGRFSMDDTRF
jgi:hypothetical protein